MPLVRIDLQKGKDAAYRRKAGRVVYEAMVACAGVPNLVEVTKENGAFGHGIAQYAS